VRKIRHTEASEQIWDGWEYVVSDMYLEHGEANQKHNKGSTTSRHKGVKKWRPDPGMVVCVYNPSLLIRRDRRI
jgi:hypothetical protein